MEAGESVLRAGYRLDRYELLCPIATGGMASVWLARLRGKRGFEKLFAVKTIRTELVDDARFQEMFLDEARIASGIQHPNVAQILDLGEQDDVLFIVMEWVDGDSLAKIRKLLAKRHATLPVGIVLRVLSDACGGLHAAHELRDEGGEPLQIVHRDVSPHNILLATSGSVKVIDFGIAKAQNRRQGETRTGIVKGKIQYMAPEQVNKGSLVDRRADIWALGMCLHELVVGRLPYDGDDDVEVIRKLMGSQAPTVAPEVPEPIARVLERTMVLDPDTRFPTAAAMQRALEAAMKELGASSTSEDVAAFLRSELPDLSGKRRAAVGKAIEEARERGTPVGALAGEGRDEVAYAPTLVGDRDPRDEPRAIALTKRKDDVGSAVSASFYEHTRATTSVPPEEPITIPLRSRGWLWVVLGVAGVGAVAFAGEKTQLFNAWGSAPEAPSARPADAVAKARTAPSAATDDHAPPMVTAVAPMAKAVGSAAEAPPGEAAPPRLAPPPPQSQGIANQEPPSPAVPAGPLGALGAPDGASPVGVPSGSSSAAAGAASPPGPSEDDPNNPYNEE
jgi:eukaryotic-like serine/threonine-protein kinase